ncbi:MAG: hypothetical protein R6X13_07105 [bacterium]
MKVSIGALATAIAVVALVAAVHAQQPGYPPTRGNVTRMDMAPQDFQRQGQVDIRTETEFGACVVGGIGAAGAKVCVSERGTVSVGASLLGGQATIYANPGTWNMGGCVGVGGTAGVGVGASASAVVCGDREQGLVVKTSVGSVAGEATTTYRGGNR